MKPSKRISVAVFVTCLLLAVLITFMTTYTILSELHTAALRESYLNPAQPAAENTKLDAVSALFDQYYYHDIDPEQIEEYIIRGYIAGTGDLYGDYFTAGSVIGHIRSKK